VRIILPRSIQGPSVPELGTPVSNSFDSMTVPLVRASTGFSPLARYEIERAPAASGPWSVQASGPLIFGNPPTAYTQGGLIANTAYFWRSRAADTANRISDYSAIVSGMTTASASNQIRANFGNYMTLDSGNYSDNPDRRSFNFSQMDSVANNPNIAGFHLKMRWSALEGATEGDYSQGFATIDAYLAKIASLPVLSRPKHLKICLTERSFATSNVAPFYPAYLANAQYGGWIVGPPGNQLSSTARINEQPTMDRLIALGQAYGARYGNNLLVEQYMMEGETANSLITNTQSINAQLKRWMTAMRAAWPNTRLKVFCNFHYPYTNDLYEHCIVTKVEVGGPDPELRIAAGGAIDYARAIDGNEWFRGLGRLGNEAWHTPQIDPLGYPTKDYREIVGWSAEQQGLGYSGIESYSTEPRQLWEFQVNTMHARDIDWSTDDNRPVASQKWTTGVLPFINSINGLTYQVGGVTPRPTCWSA
jgi:hypothetical protein